MFTTLFAAADPATFSWSPKCAVVMIACNVFAYAIARATIRKPNEGFEIPNSKFYGGLSHASVVGANCLGHIFRNWSNLRISFPWCFIKIYLLDF